MFNISRGVMGDDSPRSPFVPTPFVYEPAQPQKWEYRVERIDHRDRDAMVAAQHDELRAALPEVTRTRGDRGRIRARD